MASVGQLVVELAASTARFQEDLGKATRIAEDHAKRMEHAFEGVRHGLEALGVGLSVREIVTWASEVAHAAEELQNLASETGSTVEELSRLKNLATISGTSFDTFRSSIDRLAAGLNGSEELSTKTADALRYLGIASKDPAKALTEIAVKLNEYADGAGKAAIARDLFGRGGVQFISTLKTIAESQDAVSTTTTEQTRKATELLESYRALRVGSNQLANSFLDDVVPALSAVVVKLSEAKKAAEDFRSFLGTLGKLSLFDSAADDIGRLNREAGELEKRIADIKAGKQLIPPTLFGIKTNSDDTTNLDANLASVKKALEVAQTIRLREVGGAPNNELIKKPDLGYRSGAVARAAADDPTKKLLEAALKELQANADAEKQTVASRNEALSGYYEQGYIALGDYYAKRREVLQTGLQGETAAYDQEIALIQNYIKNATKEVDKAEGNVKLVEVIKKRQAAEAEAAKAGISLWFDEQRAAESYRHTLDDLTAQVLIFQHKTAAAQAIRFDSQNEDLKRRLQAEGNEVALANLATLRQQTIQQAQLNDTSSAFALILDDQANAQTRINLAQSSGKITELEALRQTSQLNQSRIAELTKVAEAYEAIAKATGDPAALVAADRLRLKIEELGAATDLVGKKFQDIFVNATTSAFDKIIAGGTSARDILRGFEKDIVTSIGHIASQNISESIFGKDGPLGGLGSALGGLFGGGKSAAGDAGASAALTGVATSSTSATAAITAWTQTLLASQAAMGAGGSGGGNIFGSLFGGGGGSDLATLGQYDPGFANGTSFAPGGWAIVGERGPERVNLPRGAEVIPNHVLQQKRAEARGSSRGVSIGSINISVPSGTSRATADQMAVQVAQAVNRGVRKAG